jgi:hypothetical protein
MQVVDLKGEIARMRINPHKKYDNPKSNALIVQRTPPPVHLVDPVPSSQPVVRN